MEALGSPQAVAQIVTLNLSRMETAMVCIEVSTNSTDRLTYSEQKILADILYQVSFILPYNTRGVLGCWQLLVKLKREQDLQFMQAEGYD